MAKPSRFTLSGNDIALAEFGAAHAINFWKGQGKSKYAKAQVEAYKELARKTSAILDHAYPYKQSHEDDPPIYHGDEPIMRPDEKIVAGTRRTAARFNRRR